MLIDIRRVYLYKLIIYTYYILLGKFTCLNGAGPALSTALSQQEKIFKIRYVIKKSLFV